MNSKPVYSQMIAGVGVIVLIISSTYSNNELKSSRLAETLTKEKYIFSTEAGFEEKIAQGIRLQQLYNKNSQYKSNQFYQELAVLKYAQIGQVPFAQSNFIQHNKLIEIKREGRYPRGIVDAVFTDGMLQEEGLWAVDTPQPTELFFDKTQQFVDS